MSSLPALANWDSTRQALHQSAQILGAIRAAVVQPQPNYIHISLSPIAEGVTTGTLPFGGELVLDFIKQAVIHRAGTTVHFSLPLAGHTQVSLTDAVIEALGKPTVMPKRDKLTNETPFELDAQISSDYASALYEVFTALARFRARLNGPLSPVVLWPHGFDLSFLWFATPDVDEKHPHMNFGFSPGSAGLDRPYVYSYVYPLPPNLTSIALPASARWWTQGWTGVVLPYDQFRDASNPELVIEYTLQEVYTAVLPLMEKS